MADQTEPIQGQMADDMTGTTSSNMNVPLFTERHDLNLDDIFEYERTGNDPGTVIIFNQENFDRLFEKRKGTCRDVNEIITCFQRLGFNIHKDSVQTNLTVGSILSHLDNVLENKEALKKTNCLIVFFLSHGFSHEEIHARDTSFRTSDIWTKFTKCKELKYKPKMFVFQACKGVSSTTTDGKLEENKDAAKLVNFSNFSANQLGPDMLLVYATIEGNKAARDIITGSWFIQELCKNFSSYGRRDDVISLITRTIKCVCGNYYKVEYGEILKQMPVLVSTLSKKFYLNRNKDRHVILKIEKEIQETHELVKEIAEKIGLDITVKNIKDKPNTI